MSEKPSEDWEPQSQDVQRDQRKAYDEMREHCPVAHSDFFQWSLFRHADVKQVLLDHHTYSSKVSAHVSVPNSMDPPEHAVYRKIIEPYFSPEKVSEFEPICETVSKKIISCLLAQEAPEIMSDLANPYASQIQCSFLGWSKEWQTPLLDWVRRNNQAVLEADRPRLKQLAAEFETIVIGQLDIRRHGPQASEQDITHALLHEKVNGHSLTDKEICSILRNWTVGEIGTIASAIGILIHFLATHPEEQSLLRSKPELLRLANDEILRLHNPLVTNRRKTTCPVEIRGRKIPADARLTLHWMAANRDPEVFPDPDTFSLKRDPTENLLYGTGIHVCPGKLLAQTELVILIRELLASSSSIRLADPESCIPAPYPASGYKTIRVHIIR